MVHQIVVLVGELDGRKYVPLIVEVDLGPNRPFTVK